MWTIHYNDTGEKVSGPLGNAMHARTARANAESEARESNRAIQVVRNVTVSYIIEPDGTRRPPDGAKFEKRENCTRTEDGPPCFCIACRADRRVGRPATAPSSIEPAVAPEDDALQRLLDGRL